MRTHGYREGSITHWSLLRGTRGGTVGVRELGRDNMGRNAYMGMEAANHIAVYASLQQSCKMQEVCIYPRAQSTKKEKKRKLTLYHHN